MHDIIDTVDQWLAQEQPIALATVVATWGSAPRRIGAKMAVTAQTAMAGSVSGGCVENAVIHEALAGLKDGQPRLLDFGVSDDAAWEVGLACGGKISVYVEPLDTEWWRAVTEEVRQNHAATTVTVLTGELAGQRLMIDDGGSRYATAALDASQQAAMIEASQGQRRSQRTTAAGLDVLVDVHHTAPQLVIIGGAHVSQPLQRFARELGFRVVLIDPRRAFATPERFPDVDAILHSYPEQALAEIGLDDETYLAVLTHDPKIDDGALITALPGPAPYIGVLSSKRTHQKRLERLRAAGVDPQLFARIRTPIGLNIGARTPEEIALCIMAEIVAVRNGALGEAGR